jgi:hypothetical protein
MTLLYPRPACRVYEPVSQSCANGPGSRRLSSRLGCVRSALVLRRTAGRSKPQCHLGWLHGLVGHGQQLGSQGVQVDLLVQPIAEHRDRVGGVVAAAVEAAVDDRLDAAADWSEHRRHRQGGTGHDQAGVAAHELA